MDPLEQLKLESRALAAFGKVTPETLAAVQANADASTGNSPFVGGSTRKAPEKTGTKELNNSTYKAPDKSSGTKELNNSTYKAPDTKSKPKPKTPTKPGTNDLNVKAGSRQVPASSIPKPEVAPAQKDTLSPINSALQKTGPMSKEPNMSVEIPTKGPMSPLTQSGINPYKYGGRTDMGEVISNALGKTAGIPWPESAPPQPGFNELALQKANKNAPALSQAWGNYTNWRESNMKKNTASKTIPGTNRLNPNYKGDMQK